MDPNRLYAYFIEMDWLFLIGYSLLTAGGMLIFAGDLWTSASKPEESSQVPRR